MYPQMWPTPDANMRGAKKTRMAISTLYRMPSGSGKLNPNWVAWLMVTIASESLESYGNAVVPQQAKEAFKILMGLK